MRRTRIAASALVLALTAATGCADEPKKGDTGNPPPVTPGNVDMRDYLQAVLLAPWPKDGAGVKAGSWVEIKNTTGGKTSLSRIAAVGEAGPLLQVEEQSEGFQGFIEGLTVQRADGKIVEAQAARKGEKGRAIKIGPAPTATATASGTTTDDSVSVAAGTFACKKTVIAGQLSETAVWVAKDGDARGIPVKETSDDTTVRELKSIGAEDLTIAGKPVKALHATYSDGSETWFVREVTVPFYGTGDLTWVKQTRGGTTTELAWGNDAKPEIDWAK